MPPPAFSRTPHTFTHIFSGGYAAGYYSYKWAEVLSADAYAAFEETAGDNGVPSIETGRKYRQAILEAGGSRPAMESFKAFRGREPHTRCAVAPPGHGLKRRQRLSIGRRYRCDFGNAPHEAAWPPARAPAACCWSPAPRCAAGLPHRRPGRQGDLLRPAAATPTPRRTAAPVRRSGARPPTASACPIELRQVGQRYPVTLYTGDDCGPCDAGRALLIDARRSLRRDDRQDQRGHRGAAAPERPGSAAVADHRRAAAQGLLGAEWSQYLDAAGYPKSVAVAGGYRNPPAHAPGGRAAAAQPRRARPHPRQRPRRRRRAAAADAEQPRRHQVLTAHPLQLSRSAASARPSACPAGTRWRAGARTRRPSPRPATG